MPRHVAPLHDSSTPSTRSLRQDALLAELERAIAKSRSIREDAERDMLLRHAAAAADRPAVRSRAKR